MNLVQMFTMQPPSKATIAGRLARSSSSPTPVHVSQARTAFFVRGNEVPQARPLSPAPYTLGAQGGLAGLAGFGALNAKFPIVGGVGFDDQWSFNDWKGGKWLEHIRYWKLGSYEPLSDAAVGQADAAWGRLAAAYDLGNMMAGAVLENFKARINRLAEASDAITKQHSLGTWPDSLHRERIRLFTELNRALRELAGTPVPASGTTGGSTSTSGGTSSGGGMTSDAELLRLQAEKLARQRAEQEQADALARQQSQGASTAAGGDFPTLAVVGGVAALGLVAVLVMRKKKG